MKKIILILALALIAIVVYNCKKENTSQNIVAKINTTKMFMPDQSQIVNIIKKFGKECKAYQEALKTKSPINIEDRPLDEGLWTLEAALNYDYRNPHDSLGNFVTDSMTITVNNTGIINGQPILSGNSMAAQYEVLNNFVAQQLANEPNNVLVAADLEVKESNENTTTFEVTITRGAVTPDYGWKNFEAWKAGAIGPHNNTVLCNGYDNPYLNIHNAAERIAMVINWNGGQVPYCNGGSVFYTNVIMAEAGLPELPYYNYFYHGDMGECLDYNQLLFWYNNAQYVKNQLKPYSEAKCYNAIMQAWGIPNYGSDCIHHILYYYGTLNCTPMNE